jgi:hypothetical protein
VFFIDKDIDEHFESKDEEYRPSVDDQLPLPPEKQASFGRITSLIRIEQLRDINRHIVRRHVEDVSNEKEEHRSTEVYEIHTRGACKCLVISSDEAIQYGCQTRFEKQLQRIERTYTDEELHVSELHVIVPSYEHNYQLVRRDYRMNKYRTLAEKENESCYDDHRLKQRTIAIHYYTKQGERLRTESTRRLDHLPLFIRCEIEYELNHHGKLNRSYDTR